MKKEPEYLMAVDNIKQLNIRITSIQERKDREWSRKIFEEIMAENFPEFKKKTQDHKMKGFQLRYRKKHTCSHFLA